MKPAWVRGQSTPFHTADEAGVAEGDRKHGRTAKMLIIVADVDDFDQLRAELMAEHDPQLVLETELVERLAGSSFGISAVCHL